MKTSGPLSLSICLLIEQVLELNCGKNKLLTGLVIKMVVNNGQKQQNSMTEHSQKAKVSNWL